ncbi:MAG: diguanylate cyclase [Myxococcota bacterium]|nr:diguanylate cyclase [Myxococcota bacterium]
MSEESGPQQPPSQSAPRMLGSKQVEQGVLTEDDFDHRSFPILLVEPDDELRRRFKAEFGSTFTIHDVRSVQDARRWIGEREYAAVITDIELPQGETTGLLSELAEIHPHVLRLVLTERKDHASLLQAINQARTYAYITRPWDRADLTMTLRRAVERYALDQQNRHLIAELQRERAELEQIVEKQTGALRTANQRLRKLAITDGLTGLFNHRYFQERLQREVRVAQRYDDPLSLILIDIDRFKTYNDILGHPLGDGLIQSVATILTESVRDVDLVARYGGDEFVIALPKAGKGSALVLAERIRKLISEVQVQHGDALPEGKVTASIGLATYPNDGSDSAELLNSADRALYRAKKNGRDQVNVADGVEDGAGTRDRGVDFHLLVEEDRNTPDLTPSPRAHPTQQSHHKEYTQTHHLEDGDTIEHPDSAPNLAPDPQRLVADLATDPGE